MHERYGDEVTFVGVAGRDDLTAINDFIERLDVGAFEHAVDGDGSLWASYRITTQPSFVFLDDDGSTSTHIGALGIDRLTSMLQELTS